MTDKLNIDTNTFENICRISKEDLGKCDILILDCSNGARKSALAASLLGMLDDNASETFVNSFNKAGFSDATLSTSKKKIDGIECSTISISVDGKTESDASSQNANQNSDSGHHGRSLSDVSYIIDELEIDGKAAEDAIGIYKILADAEASAHNSFPGSVHFHEVGNDYAIASIVAFCMLVDLIGPKKILATPITTGFGFVDCAHGRIPIPAPATSNIINELPTNVGDVEGELATPTGAAMISYFANDFIDSNDIDRQLGQDCMIAVGNGLDIKRFGPITAIAKMQLG